MANRHTHGILVDVRSSGLCEVKAVLPSIPQARWPEAGHWICLSPDVIVNSVPTTATQFFYRIPYEPMSDSFDNLVLDVEYQTAGRLQSFEQRLVKRQKPLAKQVGMNAVVMFCTCIRVRRRR